MITINNNSVATSGGNFSMLVAGSNLGTIVKSLELIGGSEACNVTIARAHSNQSTPPSDSDIYASIVVNLKANDYLVLWEGFFVIPSGDGIYVKSDASAGNPCVLVVNYVDMSSNQ